MLPVAIVGCASMTPGPRVSTEEIAKRVGWRKSVAELIALTGIEARHFAEPNVTYLDVALEVTRAALADAGMRAEDLSRVIYIASTGGDVRAPANANALLEALGLEGSCDAFDIANTCVGFMSALDIAARSVATGLGPVAVVVPELMSRAIDPSYLRSYVVFGDAAAAVIVAPAQRGAGVLASMLRNDGRYRKSTTIAHAAKALLQFEASSDAITDQVLGAIQKSVAHVLGEAKLTIEDVDWVLTHQPNGVMFEAMVKSLNVPESKLLPVVRELGNISSACIPLQLDRLRRSNKIRPGQVLLFVSVGGGMAFGAILYRVES